MAPIRALTAAFACGLVAWMVPFLLNFFRQKAAFVTVKELVMDSTLLPIFRPGELEVEEIRISSGQRFDLPSDLQPDGCKGTGAPPPGAPRPLIVIAPNASGTYPVMQLQHGFQLRNSYYEDLMRHVASYGYIIVAPQMFNIIEVRTDATTEMTNAANVVAWLRCHLAAVLTRSRNPSVPDFSKFVLAGHSRGGKVAFGVALRVAPSIPSLPLPLAAIIGIDPVDGAWQQTKPPVLRFPSPSRWFNFNFPALLIGSGKGGSCAPAKFGHAEFFQQSGAPVLDFVGPEYGHMDFLDADLDIFGWLASSLCQRGPRDGGLRTFTGGLIVAFLDHYLNHPSSSMSTNLTQILNNTESSPIKFSSQLYLPEPSFPSS